MYVCLLSYCLTCPCFLRTERQRQLGNQLFEACERLDWQEAISLVEKGEYTRAERHREVMFC